MPFRLMLPYILIILLNIKAFKIPVIGQIPYRTRCRRDDSLFLHQCRGLKKTINVVATVTLSQHFYRILFG
jgi:hypothetical protein